MLKVLLATAASPGGTATYVERSLRKVAEVTLFDTTKLPDKGVLRERVPLGMTAKAAARKAKVRPDLFLEIDGAGRRHLRKPEGLGVPTGFWAIDSHRDWKREWLRRVGLDFDHAFVAQKDDVPSFKGPGVAAHWLPLACDPELHKDFGVARDVDIGYVGSTNVSRHNQRMAALQLLARNYKVEAKQGLYFEEMARLYSRSKVVFNRSIGGDVNMRVFEALSCGACLVTDRIQNGQDDLFRDRAHMVAYDEWNMLDTVDEVLGDDELREPVAAAGKAEVRAKHTYDHRAAQMLRALGFPREADELMAGAAAKATG